MGAGIFSLCPGLQGQSRDSEDSGAQGQRMSQPNLSTIRSGSFASQSLVVHNAPSVLVVVAPILLGWVLWLPPTVLAPAHPVRPASSPFCTAGLNGPHPGLFPSLKRPSPTGSVEAEENSQAVSGGVVGLTQRAPGQGLRKGALVPAARLGARAARLLLPGPGVRRVEPLHNAQVRKRVQEKGNPLSERAGGSLIKPSRDCVSRAGAHGEEKRAPGRPGRWE